MLPFFCTLSLEIWQKLGCHAGLDPPDFVTCFASRVIILIIQISLRPVLSVVKANTFPFGLKRFASPSLPGKNVD
jgi:hypothetical protein